MIKKQHATKVFGIVLFVLILQGCTSAELAIDFYKKQKRSSQNNTCLLYTSPSPRDRQKSRMPSSA